MSLADELLESLSEESVVHNHSVSDTDGHFVIDPDTHQIVSTSSTPNVIMQNDHKSEIYTFEIPRYVEGHDMFQCNRIRLHFINIGSGRQEYRDVAELSLRVNPDDPTTLISSWEIRRQATQYAGNLSFLIHYECIDSDGNSVYGWHTDTYSDVEIRATFDNGETAVFEYSNILEDWYQKLFGAGDSVAENAIARIEAKAAETLASIPDDYATVAAKVNESANAIKCSKSGAVVFADDVSPVEHIPAVKVHGKNLIVFPYAESNKERDGATFTIDEVDKTVIVDGTPTQNTSYNIAFQHNKTIRLRKGMTYTLTCISSLTNTRGYVYLQNVSNGVVVDSATVRNGSSTFTATADGYVNIGIVLLSGITFTKESIAIQLEEGPVATDYEPYVDPSTITVTRHGKNLAYGGTTQTYTSNGLTIKRTEDTSEITLNGTTDGTFSHVFTKATTLAPGTYTVSVWGLNKVSSHLDRCYVYDITNSKVLVNNIMTDAPKSFTINSSVQVRIEVVFAEATSYSNKVIRLQLELGETATDYEKCKKAETCHSTSDGIVSGMTSLSPNMTVLTDTAGAIVEVEYNVDTKSYVDKSIKSTVTDVLEAIENGSY